MSVRDFFLGLMVGTVVGLFGSPAALHAQSTGVREVEASARTVIPLQTRLRYTTMIVLPESEEILDVVCGDKDYWVITATHNIAHVKPAKEGASTNLNLVAASGSVYSFLLNEGKASQPDLKVYVTTEATVTRSTPKYYSANQVQALRAELTEARAAVETVEHRSQDAMAHSQEAIATFRRDYPGSLQFAYGSPKYEKPFFVRSIWHDGQFTYIRSDARELPTLYELRDGQPSLVDPPGDELGRDDRRRAAYRAGGVHAHHRLADRAECVGKIQLGHRDAFEHVGRLADHDRVDVGPRHARIVERLDRGFSHEPGHRHVFPRGAVVRLPDPDDGNPIAGH